MVTREGLPTRRINETHEIEHMQQNGDKLLLSVTIGVFPPDSPRAGQLAEVFIDIPYSAMKTMNAMVAKDAGTLISVAVQSGADLDDLTDAMGHSEVVLPPPVGPVDLPHTIMGTVLRYLSALGPANRKDAS